MWVIALIGAATGFIESTLAQIYKEPVAKGGFYGGPAYYIRYGLNNKALSVLFAILISITYGWIYNSVQANTLAASLQVFNFDVSYTGAVVAILLGIIIFGGINRVAKASGNHRSYHGGSIYRYCIIRSYYEYHSIPTCNLYYYLLCFLNQ